MDPPLDFEIEFEDDALPEPGCSSEDLNIKADDSRTKIELQWLENYKQVTEKSNMHTLPMDEFINAWTVTLDSLVDPVKSRKEKSLLDCCETIINTFPHCSTIVDNKWITFLKSVILHLLKNIRSIRARNIISLAHEMFGTQPSRAQQFWKLYHEAHNDARFKPNTYLRLRLAAYNEQFKNHYPGNDIDYEHFKVWAKSQGVTRQDIVSVQCALMTSGIQEEEYTYQNSENKTVMEEVNFLFSWLKKKGNMTYNSLIARCEEKVGDNPDNPSYYLAYLAVLDLKLETGFAIQPQARRLYYLAFRGMRDLKDYHDDMFENFIQLVIIMAGLYLDPTEYKAIIRTAEETFGIDKWNLFIASKRSILSVTNTKIQEPQELILKFQTMLDQLKGCMVSPEFLELTLQYVCYEQQLQQLDFANTNKLLNRVLEDIVDPNKYFTLIDFVKNRGNARNVDRVYCKSMTMLKQQLSTDEGSSQICRLGHVQLLKHYLNFKYSHGPLQDQKNTLIRLIERLFEYGARYNETYRLTANVTHTVQEQIQTITLGGDHSPWVMHNEISAQNGKTDTTEVTEGMNGIRVDDEETRIFVSNLDYKAKEVDIKAALETNGIEVIHVRLKKTSQGKSEGYATCTLNYKKDVNTALAMNQIKVGRRMAFISRFQEKPKNKAVQGQSQNAKRPTLLYISAPLDEPTLSDWAETDKLHNIIAPYGHIESIAFEEKGEKKCAKVKFHMSEDALNVHQQWKCKTIFTDLPVTIQVGYVKTEKQKKDKNRIKIDQAEADQTTADQTDTNQVKKSVSKKKDVSFPADSDQAGPSTSCFLPEGQSRQALKKTSPASFIPTQLRTKPNERKRKLVVPPARTSEETPMDEDEPQKKQMSNDDFRNLLLKN